MELLYERDKSDKLFHSGSYRFGSLATLWISILSFLSAIHRTSNVIFSVSGGCFVFVSFSLNYCRAKAVKRKKKDN